MSVKIHGDNSASSCGFATGDGDTGIMPGSDVVDVVTGGTSRIKAENATTTISNNLKVDGTRTLIGANESVTANFGAAKLQVNNDGDRVASFMYAVDNGAGPHVNIVKSRGGATDLSNRKKLNNNDELGRLNFIGDDGNDLGCDGAAIIAKIDGTPASNVMPTELLFYTNDGVQFAEERMKIDKDGAVTINNGNLSLGDGNLVVANGHGIDFSAQTATNQTGASTAVELLDHYEEGTFTPVMGYATAYGTQTGKYVKIGKTVYCVFEIQVTSFGGTTTASTSVGGLPFAGASGGCVTGCWAAVINGGTSSKDWRIGPWTAVGPSLGVWMHGGGSTTGIGMDTTSFSNYSSVIPSLGTSFTMRGGVTYIANT